MQTAGGTRPLFYDSIVIFFPPSLLCSLYIALCMDNLADDSTANSSRTMQVDGSELARKTSFRAQSFDIDTSTKSSSQSIPWHVHIDRFVNARYPRIARFIKYVKGPRQKVDLPGENNLPLSMRCSLPHVKL